MKTKQLLLAASGHFATDFYINFLPALLPVMAVKLHLNATMVGFATMICLIVASFCQPQFGYWFDKHPNPKWVGISLLVSGIFMCVSGLALNYIVFLILIVIAGAGNGLYHPSGSVIAYQVDEKNRGFMMSLFSTFGSLGYAIAPAVAAFFIVKWGLPSLLILVLPLPFLVYMLDRVKIAQQPEKDGEAPVLRSLLSGMMVALIVIMVLRAWGHLVYSTYLVFLLQERGMTYGTAAAILTVFLIAGAVGGLIAGRISDIWGRKLVVILTTVLTPIFLSLFLTTGGTLSLAFLMVGGLLVGASFPVLVVLGQELMPGNIGLASGISMGFAWGVAALGVFLNGLAADHFGWITSFWIGTGVLGAAALIVMGAALLPQNTKNKELGGL